MKQTGPHLLLRLVDRLAAVLATINRPVSKVGRDLAAILVVAMVALALAQILSRTFFDYSLDWAEELARVTLVWSVLLVAPFAYRSGAQVSISSFAAALPPRLLLAVSLLLNVLIGWICVEMLRQSGPFWSRGLALTASAIDIRMAWIYAIVPVAFACLVLVAAELVLRLSRALFRPDADLILTGAVPGIRPSGT